MLAILITTLAGATIALFAQSWPKEESPPRRRTGRYFRAVSIVPTGVAGCCAACEALSSRRYLLKDAPKLPLAQCTAVECNCRYRHHSDRRQYFNPGRRVRDFGQSQPQFDGSERRLWDVSRRRRGGRRHARA
ncbi:MAG TPA: hypothetical protein VE046_08175 [Steroidobacteraceae bacterium]|nr:hypothetical protein [Steroidobacteraceae bacterium]